MKGKYQKWLTIGIICQFIFLPFGGYGSSLTIGNTVSVNGNMSATSFSGDGSGLSNVGGSSSCTPITSLPKIITASGVYCLTSDLLTAMNTGNAVEIQADDVVIDLNGHKLDGLAAGPATNTVGIYAYQRENVTIRNGTVRGFLFAIWLRDDPPFTTFQGHIIEEIRADTNTYVGLYVDGRGNIIRNNVVVNTGGTPTGSSYGIAAFGSGAWVVNNSVRETKEQGANNANGIRVNGGHGSVIANNVIGNTALGTGTSRGIYIYSNSNNVTVKGNSISNMNEGIHYETDSSGSYLDNVVSGCTTPFTGGTPLGLANYGKTTTALLYPFGTNQQGFDTAIIISNTSDQGLGGPSGTCTVSYFGANASPPLTTPNISAGTTYALVLSTVAPAFQGYIIAKCNFPQARGWGFMSDFGARNLAASIIAEVLP